MNKIFKSEYYSKSVSGCRFVIYSVVFILAALGPIYLDEAIYYMLTTRYWVEDFHRIFVFVQCKTSFIQEVPPLFSFAALLSSVASSWISSPFSLRVFGVIIFGLNYFMLRRISARDERTKNTTNKISLNVIFLGTLPFFLVMARPEGVMFLMFIVLCYLSLSYNADNGAARSRDGIVRLSASIFLIYLMYWIHPGSIAFSIIFSLCIFHLAPNTFALLLSHVAVVAISICGLKLHKRAYECPEVSGIQEFFGNYTGGIVGNVRNSDIDLIAIANRILTTFDFFSYTKAVVPQSKHNAGLIPSIGDNSVFLQLFVSCLVVVGLISFAGLVLLALQRVIRKYEDKAQLTFQDKLGIALLLTVFILSFLYPIKAAYRAVTVFFVMILSFVLLVDHRQITARLFQFYTKALSCSATLAGIGIVVLYLGLVLSSLTSAAPLTQPTSVGIFSMFRYEDEISNALKACRVDPDFADFYLVDTVTLFTLKNSSRLSYAHYSSWGFPGSMAPEDYLKELGVKGFFVFCENTPKFYQELANQQGPICCWSSD